MQVTSYQMRNVLECYRKKLGRAGARENPAGGSLKKTADDIALASDTSRMAAMDKISQQVLSKVMDVVALSSTGKGSRYTMHGSDAVAESTGGRTPVEFPFNAMDSIHRKHTGRLAAANPEE